MKKICTMLLLALVFCTPVFADTTEDVTEVYTDAGVKKADEQAPSGFHGILGAGLFSGQRIVGDDGRKLVLLPLVLVRYRDSAYWSIGGGGGWLLQSEDHSLRFGAGLRAVGGRKPDDPGLAGMERRKGSVDGYLNLAWRTQFATIGAYYYRDIGGASRGDSASLRLSRNFRAGDRLFLTPSLGAVWQDSERVDYYYGVRPEEALPWRPAYIGSNAINANAGLSALYVLPSRWSLLGGVIATRYGREIVDSPIVSRRYSTTVYTGAGWRF